MDDKDFAERDATNKEHALDILKRALKGKLGDNEWVLPLKSVVQISWIDGDDRMWVTDLYPNQLYAPFTVDQK